MAAHLPRSAVDIVHRGSRIYINDPTLVSTTLAQLGLADDPTRSQSTSGPLEPFAFRIQHFVANATGCWRAHLRDMVTLLRKARADPKLIRNISQWNAACTWMRHMTGMEHDEVFVASTKVKFADGSNDDASDVVVDAGSWDTGANWHDKADISDAHIDSNSGSAAGDDELASMGQDQGNDFGTDPDSDAVSGTVSGTFAGVGVSSISGTVSGGHAGAGSGADFGTASAADSGSHSAMSGAGVEVCADGARYEGRYLSGGKHGTGSFSRSDGSRDIGQLVDNDISGNGVFERGDCSSRFEGQRSKNKMRGHGTPSHGASAALTRVTTPTT